MTDTDIQHMIEQAAEAGATRALEKVGLHDEHAGKDVGELRSLLDSWRETKRTVTQTVARTITTALLGAIALGVWISYWPRGK
jgi:hypothetical protein